MKLETVFYQELRDELLKQLPDCHIVRIESNLTQQGIPDVNICYKGREYWIELKVNDYLLSPLQLSWHEQRRQAGGQVITIRRRNVSHFEISFDDQKTLKVNSISLLVRVMTRRMRNA